MAAKLTFGDDDCLSVRHGRLFIDDADLTELAKRFGTPLYVVSEAQLRANARAMVRAFTERWTEGPVLVMPSIKANLSLALRRILTEEGTGCDTFGPGELEAALRTGVDPERISLNGSTKDAELVERAIAAGVRITLDSVAELDRVHRIAQGIGAVAKVRLRLRPLLELEQPTELLPEQMSIRIATQRYKPGIPTEQLLAIPASTIQSPALDVRGVMAHIGRQGRDPAIWAEMARWVAVTVGELAERWEGWRPREIDLGGGFPTPRDPFAGGHDEPAPNVEEYAEATATTLRDGLAAAGIDAAGIQLEVEPGRSLYGNVGVHLTRVRHVKHQEEPVPLRWVETDTSEIFVADVVFERNRWTPVVVNRADDPPAQTADIVGISCNPDVIVPDAELPDLETGDLIAFLDTGAYQDANASNFNALPRPATVLVNGAATELIKRAETTADVFARDRIPRRLRASADEVRSDGAGPVWGLDHVSVSCSNLDRSLGFYAELLGIRVHDRGEASGGEVAAITGVDADVRWADLDLGDGRVLELLEYETSDARPSEARFFDPGSGHISLRVPDAEQTHSALVRAGVEVRGEPIELTEPGWWYGARCFYATDPDGVTVELIERP